eukprot:10403511-Alexandrium_andersonii.AAC.1
MKAPASAWKRCWAGVRSWASGTSRSLRASAHSEPPFPFRATQRSRRKRVPRGGPRSLAPV